jgi:hypothetical protein
MKNLKISCILFLISIFTSQYIYAQTPFEAKLLVGLNKYRNEKGLLSVNYDSSGSIIANYHAIYLDKCSAAKHRVHNDTDKGHDELFDVLDFKEMTFNERVATVSGVTMVGEIQYQGLTIENGTNDDVAVSMIIKGFDSSPAHKEIMTLHFPNDPSIKPVVGLCVLRKSSNLPGFSVYVVVIDFGWIDTP